MRDLFFRHMAFLAVIFCIYGSAAYACSCAFRSIEETIEQSDAIFTATAHDKKGEYGAVTYDLTVNKVWKGDVEENLSFSLGRIIDGCAFWGYQDQTEYLIYANKIKDEDRAQDWSISQCSRTKKAEDASIEMKYLDFHLTVHDKSINPDDQLTTFAKDENPKMRREALRLMAERLRPELGKTPEPTKGVYETVKTALVDNVDEVRIQAFSTSYSLLPPNDPEILKALTKSLGHENEQVVRNAVYAMERLYSNSEKEVFDILKGQMSAGHGEAALRSITVALSKQALTDEQKTEAAAFLAARIDQAREYDRVTTIQHLGFLNEFAKPYIPQIRKVLAGDTHKSVQQYTIIALGSLKDAQSAEKIATFVTADRQCYVHAAALEALHNIGTEQSLALMSDALPKIKTNFDQCHHAYASVLGNIGPAVAPVLPFLKQALAEKKYQSWTMEQIKKAVEQIEAN